MREHDDNFFVCFHPSFSYYGAEIWEIAIKGLRDGRVDYKSSIVSKKTGVADLSRHIE